MTRTIGIVGFGNQGEPWALNLRDSGYEVRIFLREGHHSGLKARSLGFSPESFEHLGEVAALAFLIPDDSISAFYLKHATYFRSGQSFIFAHGFALHFQPPAWNLDIDRILVAPKGIGTAVRSTFVSGGGVPAVLAVDHDATGNAWDTAEWIAKGMGLQRAGTYRASVRQEVEADLFSEQAILCGGLPYLISAVYQQMVRNGISKEVAYLECVHELAYITSLFQEKGIYETLSHVSPTARFGGIRGGPSLISTSLNQKLESMLTEIQNGTFSSLLSKETEADYPLTEQALKDWSENDLEVVGRRIRKRLNAGGREL